MNYTAKILLQCLVFLGLMAAATAGASADSKLVDLVDHQAGIHHIDGKSCKKLGLPDPREHQCNRVTSQAPMSSRPRTSEKSDQTDFSVSTIRPTLRDGITLEVAEIATDVRRSARRSVFWQVFAYSARLRN